MNSYNYTGKNDFDDEFLKHQTKTQFKDRLPTDKDRNNNRRSTFVDCFVGDSIINPRIDCPPGANCIKNRSNFENNFRCPTGMHYSSEEYRCVSTDSKKKAQFNNRTKLARNRKSAFFNAIVE